jgi:hypothetical protein
LSGRAFFIPISRVISRESASSSDTGSLCVSKLSYLIPAAPRDILIVVTKLGEGR